MADILSGLTLKTPVNTLPSENILAEADISYSPFVKEKKRFDNDKFNSFLEIMDGGACIQWGSNKLRSRTSYRYNKYDGAVRIDSTRYSTFSYMENHRLETSLWFATTRLHTGILVGAVFPDDTEMKLKTFEKNRFSSFGNLYSSLYADATVSSFTFRANIGKYPLHVGAMKLIKNSHTDSYRTFPFALYSYRSGTGADFKAEKLTLSLDLYTDAIRSNPKNELKFSMPVDLGMNLYRVSHSGSIALKRNNLIWSTKGFVGGGLCEGYAKNVDGMRFFLADSLRLRGINGSCGIKDSVNYVFKGHGSLVSLNSPSGFLNLAPFSEWTIFQPVNYRFYDAAFFYADIGCTGGKTFTYKRYAVNCELGIRYFTVRGKSGIKKREIVVLFPRYEDIGKKEFLDANGLFLTPRICVPLKIFGAALSLEMDGIIPVLFNSKGSDDDVAGESERNGGLDIGDLTGGISMAMCLRIPVTLK